MANGEMLTELRRMAEDGSDLSLEAGQRLTLSALADVYQTLQEHLKLDRDVVTCLEDTNTKVDNLATEIASLKQVTKEIQSNPFVAFGKHIKEHPKLALMYVIVITILITWLPYINLVRIGLLWMGIPNGVVDMVTPAIGGQ